MKFQVYARQAGSRVPGLFWVFQLGAQEKPWQFPGNPGARMEEDYAQAMGRDCSDIHEALRAPVTSIVGYPTIYNTM